MQAINTGARAMSEAQEWSSAGEPRKENNGHMANGGSHDGRRERPPGAPRRAPKQDRPAPRPQRSVRLFYRYKISLSSSRAQLWPSLHQEVHYTTGCPAEMPGMLMTMSHFTGG